ncbi:hypothetical protein GGQ54_000157 [Naumannella cuiyingiana]|uniref:DUF2871 domain-containing protein n=1 Tax=Naumannella cuiyingiana TaxID=1347891 RepID=A0A7Z0D649_9ACTN|nr:DUF2871 domain-containing protein [Naumannella cuiyingiana]NYI69597.1 hypothetical protein [Naumannella cuiyingiana]
MGRKIYLATAVWTALGLASGLFYREFTKLNGFTGDTQLAVAHTHALALGTTVGLVVLGLRQVFGLTGRRFAAWFWLWNAGLALTFGTLVAKGSLQVLGSAAADSKMLAGIAGLGHMSLTAALVLLFLALAPRLRSDAALRGDDAAALATR